MPDETTDPPKTGDPPGAPTLDYQTGGASRYGEDIVVLCRMLPNEAELARLKLEAEGISCFLRDSTTANVYPVVVKDVPLLVAAEDLERAREALKRPADSEQPGEYDDEESYRCPRCHHRTVELLPLSGIWGVLQPVWLVLVIGLIGLVGYSRIASDSSVLFTRTMLVIIPIWIIVAGVLGVLIFKRPRGKRCGNCGHQWES